MWRSCVPNTYRHPKAKNQEYGYGCIKITFQIKSPLDDLWSSGKVEMVIIFILYLRRNNEKGEHNYFDYQC